MKNKKVLAVIGVLVLLIGFYGAYRVYAHFKRLSVAPSGQTQTTGTVTTAGAAGSLRDLIAKGVPQSCTFSTDRSQGTVYVDKGKVRGDLNTTVDGQSVKSHMIVMNNTNYIWSDDRKTGIKMSFDPNATPAATSGTPSTSTSGTFDASVNMNYKCSAWVVDASQFTLPADVNFSTFAVPSQSSQASPAGGSASSQCSYCDSLTGDSKAQCLAALKCK